MSELTIPQWTVGDRMAKSRKAAGIPTAVMCDYLGIHRNSLNAYESGRKVPPRAVLRLWAMRTEVPLEWLEPLSTKWYSRPVGTAA
jgi:transcriptional regulator with XRE-family HTH domain